MIIFNSKITTEETITKFKCIFQKLSPKKIKVEDMGDKKLAYEIKKQKTGRYCIYNWYGTHDEVMEAEREMRIDDNVIKFITVKVEDDDLDEYATPTEEEMEEEAKSPAEIKSEQHPEPIDALDVLLGFAEYKK